VLAIALLIGSIAFVYTEDTDLIAALGSGLGAWMIAFIATRMRTQ